MTNYTTTCPLWCEHHEEGCHEFRVPGFTVAISDADNQTILWHEAETIEFAVGTDPVIAATACGLAVSLLMIANRLHPSAVSDIEATLHALTLAGHTARAAGETAWYLASG